MFLPALSSADLPRFTDDDLAKEMKKSSWGVVYVWTPYMHLSVKGARNISRAVASEKGRVIFVVDPKSRLDDVTRALRDTELKTSRKLASEQIIDRGSSLHYPAAFYFANGKISDSELRGYKTESAYKEWLNLERQNSPSTK